ncbi:hypothetical protein H2198_002818 [Neophaeococcomyces mojaviensis]|uniref:Uncharacterized protein n=1 Tax=Neophaeococcomyces mojaviensis TaxID=3383035 RepID=A0ACC3ACZ2_9EURO|nr:hypothetical protein H2198_002818 [Knufia sp. JES_112]
MTSDCTNMSTKMSGHGSVIPSDPYSGYTYYSNGDFYINRTIFRDVLVFFYTANYSNYDNDTDVYASISMSLAALHMHYVPKNETIDYFSSGPCMFGSGPAETSSFTRIDCHIKYSPANSSDPFHIGFPDIGDAGAVPVAFIDYYFARFKQESVGNKPISVITPKELRRFYQVYMVTKDVQDRTLVKRNFSVKISVVQISTGFVVIYSIMAFLVTLGGLK